MSSLCPGRWETLCVAQAHARTGLRHHQSVMGFRQFLLHALRNVESEWSLMTMCWNLKRIFALKPG
jgi:hypothetical protein